MRYRKLLALMLAILAPALMAGKIMYARATAPVYLVKIEGYDPRDLLYGHYLMFQFKPEDSENADSFPDGFNDSLARFDHRYYIPERHALSLEALLRDQDRVMEMEVGVPARGKAFLGDLYIDGVPMRAFLNDVEHRVDFDSDSEW